MKPQIKIETLMEAPPHTVWEALTNSRLVSQWLMETDIKPQVGFKGYFKMKPIPGFDGNITAEVLEVEENRLFVYTWQSSWMKKPTTIRFTLTEKENGTLLTLEHWGFEGILGGMLKMMMNGGWKKMMQQRIPALLKQMK